MQVVPYTPEGYQLLHEGTLTFSDMQQNGIKMDVPHLKNEYKRIGKEIKTIIKKLDTFEEIKLWKNKYKGKFTLQSDEQLADILFEEIGYEPKKFTDSGAPSVDHEALSALESSVIDMYLRYRKLEKTKTTYIKNLLKETWNGYLHPGMNLNTARTFRSSSSNPNIQNQPTRDPEIGEIIRKAFITRKNSYLVAADYGGIEVKGSCVVGDTSIETIDGPKKIKNVIRQLKREKYIYVYGYSITEQRIKIAKVTDGGLTRKKAPIYKITLDNGKSLKTTPDHQFMLRNGEYKKAKDLKENDSLMPFYKSTHKKGKVNYQNIYLNNGNHVLAHNLIAEDIYNQKITKSGLVVHHKDGNGMNNSLNNLKIMTRKEHMKIHSIQGWKNNRKTHLAKNWMCTEKNREHAIELNKQRKQEWTIKDWEEFGNRISEGIIRNGGRSGSKNSMYGKKQSEYSKQRTSEVNKNNKYRLGKKGWSKGLTKENNASLQKISNSLKGKIPWNTGKNISEITKQKISKKTKGLKRSDETKQKISVAKKEYWKNKKKIQCPLCEKWYTTLTNTHLMNKHNMTLEKFNEQYPNLNHKIISIEFFGYEDVYNINVEGIHNYATEAGVIIKNCFYHKDPTMMEYLTNPESSDMHSDFACLLFILDHLDESFPGEKTLRKGTKNGFTFPQFYGDYYGNNALSLWDWMGIRGNKINPKHGHEIKTGDTIGKHLINNGIKNYKQFEKHVQKIEKDMWENRFPVYKKWRDNQYKSYLKNGYVEILSGFVCQGMMDRNATINYPIQGVCFHCLLWSCIQLNKLMKKENMRSKLIFQVHDEIIADVHKDEYDEYLDMLKQVMVHDLRDHFKFINVPMEIEVEASALEGNWFEMEKVMHYIH